MDNRDPAPLIVCAIGFVAASILLYAVIESGLLPLAIGLGVVVFVATLVVSRQWMLGLWAGGYVTAAIAMIGAFNVLAPGWYQNLF